jgi:Flp pilus assembly protein TadB
VSSKGSIDDLGPSARILRRRQEAARARRSQLLRADLALGLLLALLVLVLAPGLAIAAIIALTILAACGTWMAVARLRARRHREPERPHLAAGATRYRVGRRRRGGASEEEREPQPWI